jgi:hypothetical protein
MTSKVCCCNFYTLICTSFLSVNRHVYTQIMITSVKGQGAVCCFSEKSRLLHDSVTNTVLVQFRVQYMQNRESKASTHYDTC